MGISAPAALRTFEKSPPRIASVGTEYTYEAPWRSRKPSQPKKKKVLSFDDRPAHVGAVLILRERGALTPALLLKKVFAFSDTVAEEFVRAAVECVRTRIWWSG